MQIIKILDYTDCTGVDYAYTGDFSGEWFADQIKEHITGQLILLDIDGTSGIHPNFLEGVIDTLLEKKLDVKNIEIKSDEEPEWKVHWHKYVAYMLKKLADVVDLEEFWRKYFFYKTGRTRKEAIAFIKMYGKHPKKKLWKRQ